LLLLLDWLQWASPLLFRRWWCEAASSSEAGFNVVHGISLVLFAVAQR